MEVRQIKMKYKKTQVGYYMDQPKLYSVMPFHEEFMFSSTLGPLIVNCNTDSNKFPKEKCPLLYILDSDRDAALIRCVEAVYASGDEKVINKLNKAYYTIISDYTNMHQYIDCIINSALDTNCDFMEEVQKYKEFDHYEEPDKDDCYD